MAIQQIGSEMEPRRRGPTVVGLFGVVGGAIVLAIVVLGVFATWMTEHGDPPRVAATSVVGASVDDGFTVWDRNDDGSPVRWDPCSPIEFVLSPDGAPSDAVADLERALDQIAGVTGLSLTFVGETDARPAGDRSPYQPRRYGERWAPVLVAWTEPGAAELPLRDTDRGVAIPVAVGAAGDRTYVTGQIVLSTRRTDLVSGFASRENAWGATLVHELGHVVGLGHVDDPDELMHVFPGSGPIRFGPGDRRGLDVVGADGGCRDGLVPQPVELVDLPS